MAEEYPEAEEEKPDATEEVSSQVTENPLFLDVLLYPTSVSGIIHVVILFFVPQLLLSVFNVGFWMRPPIGTLWILVIAGGYFFYYFGLCVRDSAGGGRRAPDVNMQPVSVDVDQILSELFHTVVSVLYCVGPAAGYFIVTKKVDVVFWILISYAIVFFPMVCLGTVLFDSLAALNPILIISSILKTFFCYMGLVLLFCFFGASAGIIILRFPRLGFLAGMGFVYLAMVGAHILGRFYLRQRQKLGWEV